MHECHACGLVCDCDGEDTWNDAASETCECNCPESQGDDEDDHCQACDEDDDSLGANYLADEGTVHCGICDRRVLPDGRCPDCDGGDDPECLGAA